MPAYPCWTTTRAEVSRQGPDAYTAAGWQYPSREEEVPVDPSAIELRYRYHRARRQARVRAKEETKLARYRFYIVMAVLLAIAIAFVVVSWQEIQRLFGI